MKRMMVYACALMLAGGVFAGCASMKFYSAVQNGDLAEVKAMLAAGEIAVNDDLGVGKTALFIAVQNNQYETAEYLIKEGADPDIKNALSPLCQKGGLQSSDSTLYIRCL